MFKIITWNVNSIRARLSHLLLLLKKETPDILLLQEIKCEDNAFPYMEIEEYGYSSAIFGQKSYNGVAIFSKEPIEDIKKGVFTEEARYIEAVTYLGKNAIKLASVYVPNGAATGLEAKLHITNTKATAFKNKLKFLDKLYEILKKELQTNEIFILGGDINIAPTELDVYSDKALQGSICYLAEEKEKFKAFKNLGYGDAIRILCGQQKIFSWYDYRKGAFENGKGLRIDHFLTSPAATDKLQSYKVLNEYRNLEKPSDHVPIQITININPNEKNHF